MIHGQAKEIAAAAIPVIDMAPLHEGRLDSAQRIARQLLDAAESIGFVYVRNHGISQDLIARADAVARRFFALPLDEKQKVKVAPWHRGYIKVGEAKMYETAKIDLKESFIWGAEVGSQADEERGRTQTPRTQSMAGLRSRNALHAERIFHRSQSVRKRPVSRIRRQPRPRPRSLQPAVRSADYAWGTRLLSATAARSRRRSVRRRAAHGLRLPHAALPGSDRRAGGTGPQRRVGDRASDRRHSGRQHRRLDGAMDEQSIQVHAASRDQSIRTPAPVHRRLRRSEL